MKPKKYCEHDDVFYSFPIRIDGKQVLHIRNNTKLKDFLKEMKPLLLQMQIKKSKLYYRNLDGNAIVIDTQSHLEQMLQNAKYLGSLPIYIEVPVSLNSSLTFQIFYECRFCTYIKENKKNTMETYTENIYNDDSSMISIKTNLRSISSRRNSEDVKTDETFHDPVTPKKLWYNLHKKQTESKEMKVSNELNDLNTVPPLWFKEYMETMKNDMVHKITHEVTKKLTKNLIKHFDFFPQYKFNELNQSQNTSSPLKGDSRETRCFSEPIEKNQDQKKSQDKEQSSDASIELVEEPQNADVAKDIQVTKNDRSTVKSSKKIIKDILKNKTSVKLVLSVPSKKYEKSDSIKKNRRETTPQVEKQLSNEVSIESQNATTAKDTQLDNLSEVNFIKDKIREFVLEEEEILKKHHKRDVQIATDNLENDAKSQEKSDENSFTTNPKLRPITSADWKPRKIENGFHMSCSVTGHQMLDENQQNKDIWSGRCNDADDIDKISFCSCDQGDDDDTFEIIQMPTENDLFEKPVAEQQRHDSNSDSPSQNSREKKFELLEPLSPCSICITEDHFAANEGKEDSHLNNDDSSTNCGEQPEFNETVKSVNNADDLKKRSGGTYSFVTETLPVQHSNSFCKSLRAKQRLNEGKYSRDDGRLPEDTGGLYDEVRNSHTSYLTVQTHCDWQSQCANLGDLTQSFHSHTTSINDITDVSHHVVYTDHSHSSQMPSTDSQDAATIPRNSLDPQVGNDQAKNTRMNEMHDTDSPKFHASTSQDGFTDTVHQFHWTNGSSNRSSPKKGSGKTFAAEQPLNNVDSVHILPETLVIAAAQVGSFAYDTAREVFDKIRAHAKEDSTKRRSGTKSDHKKPFGNLPFI